MEVLSDETADAAAGFLALPFGEQALALGIGRRFTRRYRPQTNGKAERFIRTLINEWACNRAYSRSGRRTRALTHYLSFSNTERRNSALGNQTPAARLASYL